MNNIWKNIGIVIFVITMMGIVMTLLYFAALPIIAAYKYLGKDFGETASNIVQMWLWSILILFIIGITVTISRIIRNIYKRIIKWLRRNKKSQSGE